VWKFGSWFAAVRLVSLWSMVIGFRYGDWRQVPGFFLSLLLEPELIFVARVVNTEHRWLNEDPRLIVYLAVLVFFTSYLYAGILLRLSRALK
jgi:hypothetical protein